MGKIERIVQIVKDPRWWIFFLQRRICTPSRRAVIAACVAGFNPRHEQVDPVRAEIGAKDLNVSGLHLLGQLLTGDQARQLVDYFEKHEVHDPYRSSLPKFLPLSNDRPLDAHIAHHDAGDILNAPYLLGLANDPRILDVVSQFLGCKPTIGYMAAWWSYATALGPQQAENFHRDVDDWRFVKLFVYLTDVEVVSGPHKYVLFSSNQSKLNEIRRFDDEEVINNFGHENIQTMIAKAGEGFLENTYGIHKGQPVESGHRLLFQVVYSMTSLPYAPKKALMRMPQGESYDPWINRVYLTE